MTVPANSKAFNFQSLERELKEAKDDKSLFSVIVNAPFAYVIACAKLRLGIVVLLLVNRQTKTIDRIALTQNELAEYTKKMSVKRFEDIKIPVGYKDNVIAQAIATGQPRQTSDWRYLFAPALSPQEARLNQAGGAIATSVVYPLVGVREGGALIFSYYQYPQSVGKQQHKFMKTYTGLITTRLAEPQNPPKT